MDHLVAPVVPRSTPASPARPPIGHPLPLPELPPLPGDGALVFGMGRLDASGRITDRAVFTALTWSPGTRHDATLITNALVVRPDPAGVMTISGHHGLTVPAPYRHWCGLLAGDRVLLVGDPAEQFLIIHNPAALRVMVAGYHAWLAGGGDGES